ncbi:MAG: response regulator [Pseudomonadota bacterium]
MVDATSPFKVLLVENGRTARAVMTQSLEDKGYAVTAVSNGKEAIDAVRSTPYDLVIMDLYMPEMNGHEATKQIRQFSQVTVIGLSASNEAQDAQLCRDSGMNEFILKSDTQDGLLATLARYAQAKKPPSCL